MTIHPILIAPHPILRKKAQKVQLFDEELRQLADDMLETMYDAPGIGLAAPQIGISLSVVVTDCMKENESEPNPRVFINPEILKKSEEISPYNEGCLSLPGIEIAVKREHCALVRYQDLDGKTHTEAFTDMQARCLMHEIDHLLGILIVDYTSQLSRSRILRELRHQKSTE